MQLGEFQIDAVDTGEFRLDGGAMFGVVPRVLWQKTNPPDENNRIRMALRCLLIRGQGKCILVDSGIGNKWNDKQRDMYAIDHSKTQMESSLKKLGIEREDITHVVLTHLHFDHVGGTTRVNPDGTVELTFPHAEVWAQQANLTHAHAPTEKDRASFVDLTIKPLQESGKLKLQKGPRSIVDGVDIIVHHGHTPGQQLVKVSSEGKTVLFCGDTIPTASHIPVPYVMAYDLYPMTTIAEKKALLPQAVAEKWVLVFAHDPLIAACTVVEKDGRYAKGETVTL